MTLESRPATLSHSSSTSRGFTLMELLVVITIIGLLVAVVARNFGGAITTSKQQTCRAQISNLKSAVDNYKLYNNKLPESLDLLIQPDPKNGNEPYLDSDSVPLDPWDNEYQLIKETATKYEIVSYGADAAPGGEGEEEDISSKKLKK